tara:strand:+ start:265 stop:438 length:174 start_codon:yes stop_codon:yes gene_type:complete
MIKVKVFLTVAVDEDEYIVPSDGNVEADFEDALREYFHDISGTRVTNLRITQETKDE